MALNLAILKSNKKEILKAEIGALLFNFGKTHVGFWEEKNGIKYLNINKDLFKSNYGYEPFRGYKKYYEGNPSPFEIDLNNVAVNLKNFIFNEVVKFPNKQVKFKELMFGGSSNDNFVRNVFFRGCENINSGIDKGSPIKPLNELWIANAFGSFKKMVQLKDFDSSRKYFFKDLDYFLDSGYYYSDPNWKEIRNWIFTKIIRWYSNLLSDSRFPVNDVTLWDQAYMTASLFKAVISAIFLDSSLTLNYLEKDPQFIKWSILGIQYDKLGLAEKGLKPGSIDWYRNASVEVDNKIKELIEVDYPLGNEVYRDETGIYFVVSEKLKGDKEGDFYKLDQGLNEVKEKILSVFKEEFGGEVYPSILLTKPSRGIMNLGHLVEKAKENFLKAEIPDDFGAYLKDDANPNGLCQICGMRLAQRKKSEDSLICDICQSRKNGRIDKWLNNIKGETIWTGELQDKNGRIALVTLKFELNRWINGDLINSLLIREGNYFSDLRLMKDTLASIKRLYNKNAFTINSFISKSNNNFDINYLIDIEKILCTSYISDSTFNNKKFGKLELKIDLKNNKVELIDKNGKSQSLNSLIDNNNFKKFVNIYDFKIFNDLSKDAYNGCKKNGETFEDYIKQIFFGSTVGNKWEEFISKEINDWDQNNSEPLNQKINFQDQTIDWQKLDNADIEFLSELFLQFLLRKNPSPARLRRVWETTKEFFEYVEKELLNIADIKIQKQKSLMWSNVIYKDGNKDKNIPDGEYQNGEIVFWASNGNVYLITPVEKFINKYSTKSISETYKDILDDSTDWIKDEEIKLEKINNSREKYNLKIKQSVYIRTYKPYFSIISPTPVSWQFIIPAENMPALIENIQKEYYKNFRWVYGKLPLHIGAVIQNYKKPLYIGIKALRKIRRDGQEWQSLKERMFAKELKAMQKTAFNYRQPPEKVSDCESFYSLFEKTSGNGKYEFYLYPDSKRNNKQILDITQNSSDADKFYFYPNTFDFEFLDTNIRRNDILYNNAKRSLDMKANRPYSLEDWKLFENFKKYFEDKKSSSKLQTMVYLIYSKISDWDNEESLKKFMISAFVNVLDLKSEKQKDNFASVLGIKQFDELKKADAHLFKKKLLMFIDMFEFWHTAIKEV